jgi:hypothetical protein
MACVDGNFVAARQHTDATGVIAVLMRDQNGVQAGRGLSDFLECRLNALSGYTCVNEHPGFPI